MEAVSVVKSRTISDQRQVGRDSQLNEIAIKKVLTSQAKRLQSILTHAPLPEALRLSIEAVLSEMEGFIQAKRGSASADPFEEDFLRHNVSECYHRANHLIESICFPATKNPLSKQAFGVNVDTAKRESISRAQVKYLNARLSNELA